MRQHMSEVEYVRTWQFSMQCIFSLLMCYKRPIILFPPKLMGRGPMGTTLKSIEVEVWRCMEVMRKF
jgi:hypothetical protein